MKDATGTEQKLWSILRNRQMAGLKFLRQYSVGPYILDFYCPERRLAIEVDGRQHADLYGQQHDAHRDSYLRKLITPFIPLILRGKFLEKLNMVF